MNFYNAPDDAPLSRFHNTEQWPASQLGRLHAETDGAIYLRELPAYARSATLAWRVVDARWSTEDSTMTHFRAYSINSDPLPWASFGVSWDGCEHRIGGGFRFMPERGLNQYVPVDNKIHTPNIGGYFVQVLDRDNPSEILSFGMRKSGQQHQALIISFQLVPLGLYYPNDFDVQGNYLGRD
jgi:hypothetical protein